MKSLEDTILDSERIGERIQDLRKNKLRVSQTKFACLLGYANSDNVKSIISQWEKGREVPPRDKLVMMSEVCGVSIDYILCRSDHISDENEVISNITGLSDESIEVLKNNMKTGDNRYLQILNLILSDEELFNDLMKNLCNLVAPPRVAITKQFLGDKDYILLTQENLDTLSYTPDKIFHNIRNVFEGFHNKNKNIDLIRPNEYHPTVYYYDKKDDIEE